MRQISFKKGVCLEGLQPEMLKALDAVADVFLHEGHNCVVTSARDGIHGRFSHHYKGLAIDLRVWDIEDIDMTVDHLRMELGTDYQVFNEVDHIHIEYDPEKIDG